MKSPHPNDQTTGDKSSEKHQVSDAESAAAKKRLADYIDRVNTKVEGANLPATIERTSGLITVVIGNKKPSDDIDFYVKVASGLTLERICRQVVFFEVKLPSLAAMIREGMQEEDLIIELCMLIDDLQKFFKLPEDKILSNKETAYTASFVLMKFPSISLIELAQIFGDAKIGKYGQLYGRIDGNMICSFINSYLDAYKEQILLERQAYHQELKAQGLA